MLYSRPTSPTPINNLNLEIMLIQQGTLAFPSFSGTGPQNAEQAVNFSRPTANTVALLSGFDVQFVDDDHHLHLMEIDLQARNLSNQSIEVTGVLGLRDRSGDWDDRYAGSIRYTIIGTEATSEALGGVLAFPSQSGAGPITLNENVQYAGDVGNSVSILTGFKARYTTEDHHLLQLEIDLQSQMPATNQLQVSGTYGLKDSSGNWDDNYDGSIQYAGIGINRSNGSEIGTPQVRTGRMEFNPHSGSGPREATMRISFDQPIGNCAAALTGVFIGYDNNDHHIHRMIVEVEARKMNDTDVEVIGRFGLRDNSNHWDDRYRGSIRFAVIAE